MREEGGDGEAEDEADAAGGVVEDWEGGWSDDDISSWNCTQNCAESMLTALNR